MYRCLPKWALVLIALSLLYLATSSLQQSERVKGSNDVYRLTNNPGLPTQKPPQRKRQRRTLLPPYDATLAPPSIRAVDVEEEEVHKLHNSNGQNKHPTLANQNNAAPLGNTSLLKTQELWHYGLRPYQKFTLPNFRSIVADQWSLVLNATQDFQQSLQGTPELQRARQAVKGYNKFVERAVDAPAVAMDYGVSAFKNITQPFYESRTGVIKSRDAVLDAFLRRQKASWSPVVAEAQRVAATVKRSTDTFHKTSGALFLNQFTDGLFRLRSSLEDLDDNQKLLRRSALLCLVNRKCCQNPSPCLRPSPPHSDSA